MYKLTAEQIRHFDEIMWYIMPKFRKKSVAIEAIQYTEEKIND
jgi:hypothetical protein